MTINTKTLSNNLSREVASKQTSASANKQERPDAPDFADLMVNSNADHQKEVEKLKASEGEGGTIKFGETKDDKAFKEMLQRVTGQKPREAKNKLEKEDFLNLMVTQLKYQDPTKPADHKDMATQLAQFNSVEQLASANKSLENINKTQLELKSDKMTEYLGKEVTAKGNKMRVRDDGSPTPNTKSHFEIAADAGSVVVTITNEKGEAVKNIALGNVSSGEHSIDWDGSNQKGEKVPAGLYTFEVTAQTVDGKKIAAESRFTAEVTGVSQLSKGGRLETALGDVEAKDISAIRKPGSAPQPSVATKETRDITEKSASLTETVKDKNEKNVVQAASPISSSPQSAPPGLAQSKELPPKENKDATKDINRSTATTTSEKVGTNTKPTGQLNSQNIEA